MLWLSMAWDPRSPPLTKAGWPLSLEDIFVPLRKVPLCSAGRLDFSQEEPLCRAQPAQLYKADLPGPVHKVCPHMCVRPGMHVSGRPAVTFISFLKGCVTSSRERRPEQWSPCVGLAQRWGDMAVQTPWSGDSLLPTCGNNSTFPCHNALREAQQNHRYRGLPQFGGREVGWQGSHTCQVQQRVRDRWNPATAPASCQLSLTGRRPLWSWLERVYAGFWTLGANKETVPSRVLAPAGHSGSSRHVRALSLHAARWFLRASALNHQGQVYELKVRGCPGTHARTEG